MNVILRNNTGNKEKQELINGFVVRTKPFKLIFKEISASISDKPEQNYIIIGQRGAGKTTLLYRLKYEIEDKLADRGIIPVMLSEEQYNLSDLADLWENIASILDEKGYFKGLEKKMVGLSKSTMYEEHAFSLLENTFRKGNNKIILFIENVDSFFKKIGKSGQKRLREVLMTSPYLRFICSATTYFEAITNYEMPFYGFFKAVELRGLTKEEAKELLIKIGEEYGQKDAIENIIRKSPRRLESLRRLTGGVPRTISYLFDIFLDNENGRAIKDLYRLMDDLTFLYKSELDQLSSQQQKVIDTIAKNWDAIAVKDIVDKTRFPSKQVSAILQALEKDQVVEKVATTSKNNIYRIRERFMNIWYLMRFGKPHEKESVLWLVRFYDAWCDRTELANHINRHLQNLADGKYDLKAAVYMGNTFLRCENVPEDLRYNIYKSTKAVWPRKSIGTLQYSDNDLYERIKVLMKKKQYMEAITVLEDINVKNEQYYLFASFIYSRSGDYVKAEEFAVRYAELVPEKGIGAYRVGMFNWYNLKNTEKAITYFKKALELKEYKAAYSLGNIYYTNENIEQALLYFLEAAEHDDSDSYMPIATIYVKQRKYDLAEKYCQKAIQANNNFGYLNLGCLQEIKGSFDQAKQSYETALEKGLMQAYLNLGNLEAKKHDPDVNAAVTYFKLAQKHKVEGAELALAQLYLEQPKQTIKGVNLLKKQIAKGDSDAAHVLGHFFSDTGKNPESDFYFQKSIELGRREAALCQASEIFDNGRTESKVLALQLLRQNEDIILAAGVNFKMEYAAILVWNDCIEEAQSLMSELLSQFPDIFKENLERETRHIIGGITQYITLLIAKGLTNLAKGYFVDDLPIDLKSIIKPVYFALMHYMKKDFPSEFLKAGEELKDTVQEVIESIEKYKTQI